MKCWNSAFNAQRLRVIIIIVQVRAVKICVAAIGGKPSLDPSYLVFEKNSFPATRLMPYYAETGRSGPLIGWLYG